MADTSVISVRGLSKRFRLQRGAPRSLKDRLVNRSAPPSVGDDHLWALRDIDLEIGTGETVGLIGHNGSGKSTLLKCIGGILTPTEGAVSVNGRLASLLELGAGFHPDLTGRENVYLNGSILGLSRREIERRFDGIVEFAELEDFIDNPVKFYSSGMYVRLGFAVAVNVDPDILLVDEVLAVGDEAFQRKCLDRVRNFQRQGRTIVLVSHSIDLVQSLCDRAVVLDHGTMIAEGPSAEAVTAYRRYLYEPQTANVDLGDTDGPSGDGDPAVTEAVEVESAAGPDAAAQIPEGESADMDPKGSVDEPEVDPLAGLTMGERHEHATTGGVRIVDVHCGPVHGETTYVSAGEAMDIVVTYEAGEPIDDAMFGIAIADGRDGKELFGVNSGLLDVEMPVISGRGTITFRVDAVPLLGGSYPVTVGITSRDEGTIYDWREQRHRFEVLSNSPAVGTVDFDVRVETAADRVPVENSPAAVPDSSRSVDLADPRDELDPDAPTEGASASGR